MSRPFLDSNILLYAASLDDERNEVAAEAIASGGRISTQVLSEFTTVARRKLLMSWAEIDDTIESMLTLCPDPVAVDLTIFRDARRIAERYGYQLYDSQIIAAALAAGSRELLSEDMQHGQVIEGRLAIRNPFL